MALARSDRTLLQDVLKRVSRSFYLTLAVLPRSVRDQIGLAYLLARAADTIADAGSMTSDMRVHELQRLKRQFTAPSVDIEEIRDLQHEVAGRFGEIGERRLLEELVHCFELYQRFPLADRQEIARLLPILIEGMLFDLRQFPESSVHRLTALPTMADLDYYTYAVAGCVGEFWTRMMCAHIPRLSSWDRDEMVAKGIRFGKGLQLINILRDIPADVRRGRCYIPFELLEAAGLCPSDLLDERAERSFRPIFRQLVGVARDHLDHGWAYTMAVPRAELRLRLACMWPILIGMRTLHKLVEAPTILAPQSPIKISRAEVYRMLTLTTLTGGCGYVGTAYWGSLRKRLSA